MVTELLQKEEMVDRLFNREEMMMIMTIKKRTKLQKDVDDAIIINGTLWEIQSTFYTTPLQQSYYKNLLRQLTLNAAVFLK